MNDDGGRFTINSAAIATIFVLTACCADGGVSTFYGNPDTSLVPFKKLFHNQEEIFQIHIQKLYDIHLAAR